MTQNPPTTPEDLARPPESPQAQYRTAARYGPATPQHPDAKCSLPPRTRRCRSGTPRPSGGIEAPRTADGKAGGRPSNLVLAGAGSLLAVLAFLGGTAVGHALGRHLTQQNQFGGPGGGGRHSPGQGQGTGQGPQGPQNPGRTGHGPTQQGQGVSPRQLSPATRASRPKPETRLDRVEHPALSGTGPPGLDSGRQPVTVGPRLSRRYRCRICGLRHAGTVRWWYQVG